MADGVDVFNDYPLLGALHTGAVVSRDAMSQLLNAVHELAAFRAVRHAPTNELVTAPTPAPDDESLLRPWSEFRTAGLLWLINTVVFHPRGYAIGIGPNPGDGWMLQGDGRERWSYDTADPDFVAELDDAYLRAQATLAPKS